MRKPSSGQSRASTNGPPAIPEKFLGYCTPKYSTFKTIMEGNRRNRIGKIRGTGIKNAIDCELETPSRYSARRASVGFTPEARWAGIRAAPTPARLRDRMAAPIAAESVG